MVRLGRSRRRGGGAHRRGAARRGAGRRRGFGLTPGRLGAPCPTPRWFTCSATARSAIPAEFSTAVCPATTPRPPGGDHVARAAAACRPGGGAPLRLPPPLERALETAAPVAAQFGLEVRVDVRLIEPWNHFEGERFDVGFPALRRPANWPRLA